MVKILRQKKIVLFGILFPVLLIVDQWTKYLVHNRFSLGESISLIPSFFNLTYVRNTGAAFGMLAQADAGFRVPFFIIVPVIALFVVSYMFKKLPPSDVRTSAALSLIMSGAIGNLIDRVRLGFVVDFLDFHWNYTAHFPAFNVADSAICIGVGLMMLDVFMEKKA